MTGTCVIAGSFDPITLGHTELAARAARIFSSVIIAVCTNSEKRYFLSEDQRFLSVKAVFEADSRVSVVKLCDRLLCDFVLENNAVLVKGARNATDFDYEKNLYEINAEVSGVDTVIFPASSARQFISSTFVREMIKYGKPLDKYMPKEAIPFVARAL